MTPAKLRLLGLLGGGVKINLMKYAHCKTRADVEAVNPDYINDLTADDEWVYPLPNLESFNLSYQEKAWANGKLKKWRVPLPKLTSVPSWWFSCPTLEYMDLYAPEAKKLIQPMRWCGNVTYCKIYAPKATMMQDLVTYNSKLKEIEIDTPNVITAQGAFFRLYGLERIICAPDIFHNVTNGIDMYVCNYKLIDFPTSYPSLSTAPGMFDACEISGQQAITILNSIPAYTSGTHNITMGIHVDYQNDANVLAAIDNATAKGWTVATQWNGTPTNTVSTFGFKRVYVRKQEDEQGEYVAADSTRWQVEWCDMLSAPDGSTPEDHGYELYRSVEAAVAYWELAEYEQEELLTTIIKK